MSPRTKGKATSASGYLAARTVLRVLSGGRWARSALGAVHRTAWARRGSGRALERRRQLRAHEGQLVDDDGLGDAQPAQPLDAGKLAEARVLQPAHRQRLAHVAAAERARRTHATRTIGAPLARGARAAHAGIVGRAFARAGGSSGAARRTWQSRWRRACPRPSGVRRARPRRRRGRRRRSRARSRSR